MNRNFMRARPRIGVLSVLTVLLAQQLGPTYAADMAANRPADPIAPKQFVTRHEVSIAGRRIPFVAKAGEIFLYNDAGDAIGSVFSYAYLKEGVPSAQRPVTFVFGGGPGAASLTLQVGGLGPWSVAPDRLILKDGHNPRMTPPFDLVDNQNSILDATDLVFVDPVGTGYSRPIGKGRGEDFWGIDEDADSLAQFIQLWITQNKRWNSPKFYLGESYGGLRAATLTRALTGGPTYIGNWRGVTFNGIVVLVNSLGWPMGGEGIGTEALKATEFPNQAATAWYHQTIDRRGRTLQAYYEEAQEFAEKEYLPALLKEGAKTLSAEERSAVVAKLTAFTGLAATAYENQLSLTREEFAKRILASKGLQVSAYDSRYTYPQSPSGGDPVADDAALSHEFSVLIGAMANLEANQLHVQMERPFSVVNWRDLLTKWNFVRHPSPVPQYPPFKGTTADELAVSMNRNENLHLMIGTGYYDLLFAPAQAQFVADHTAFPKERLILRAYESGHELYLGEANTKLANDLRDFIRKASR
jgi:carboxypeptidase C (cathepsin A)